MQLTVQNGVARAVFLPGVATVRIVNRSGSIKIELSAKAQVVAARFQSKADAIVLIQLLRTDYNLILSDQDKTTLLDVKF
jgi:hypothetical protein